MLSDTRGCFRGWAVSFVMCTIVLLEAGCETGAPQQEDEAKVARKIERRSDWIELRVPVYPASGLPMLYVEAIVAIYEVPHRGGSGSIEEARVVEFTDPGSGLTYVGPCSDFYAQTASSILGISIEPGGVIVWHESQVRDAKPGQRANQVVERFEDETNAEEWNRKRLSDTLLQLHEGLGPEFSSAAPYSSQAGMVQLQSVSVADGTLQMRLKNQSGELTGTVWIDIKSRKILKGELEGEHKPWRRL